MKLKNIRIVLVNPSHPGNIGAVARALKTMGIDELFLVNPKEFPSPKASIRASGAGDILENAVVVSSLQEALTDCVFVYGTSARLRSLEKPQMSAREAASAMVETPFHKVAILFGSERVGLSNEDLSLCHTHIVIPTVDDFSSLNLAAAVQVVCYELRCSFLEHGASLKVEQKPRQLASSDQVLGFYHHLEQTLTLIEYLNPRQPRMLMQRLQRLFNRASLDTTEINILRGILSRIEYKLNNYD